MAKAKFSNFAESSKRDFSNPELYISENCILRELSHLIVEKGYISAEESLATPKYSKARENLPEHEMEELDESIRKFLDKRFNWVNLSDGTAYIIDTELDALVNFITDVLLNPPGNHDYDKDNAWSTFVRYYDKNIKFNHHYQCEMLVDIFNYHIDAQD